MGEQRIKSPSQRRIGCWLVPLVVVLLLIGGFAAYRVHLKRRIASELDAIRRAGYPATSAELDAWYEWPPPGEENAADVYLRAFALLVLPRAEEAEDLSLFRGPPSPSPDEPLPEEKKQAIVGHLAANKETLGLLHRAAGIRHCRYPIDLTHSTADVTSHLGDIRRSADLLGVEVILHAESGRPAEACRSLVSFVALARSLEREPTLISEVMRGHFLAIGTIVVERVLSRTSLTDSQLEELSGALLQAEQSEGLLRAMAGERAAGSDGFRQRRLIRRDVSLGGSRSWLAGPYMALGLCDRDHLRYLEHMNELVRICTLPVAERPRATQKLQQELEKPGASRPGLTQMLTMGPLPFGSHVIEVDSLVTANLRAARTALAVERFRLAAGGLPDALDELVPRYVEAIPEDPFDGRPLRYKKLEKGYVVYSIGPDARDDAAAEKGPDGRRAPDITFTVPR